MELLFDGLQQYNEGNIVLLRHFLLLWHVDRNHKLIRLIVYTCRALTCVFYLNIGGDLLSTVRLMDFQGFLYTFTAPPTMKLTLC